jgi:hypothetical protein
MLPRGRGRAGWIVSSFPIHPARRPVRKLQMKLLARDFLFSEYSAGKVRKYIRPFNLQPGDRVYLVLRVSNCERRSNLKYQEDHLRKVVAAAGAVVVGVCRIVISGRNPSWLWRKAHKAKVCGATVMLAYATDRFIRNRYFHAAKKYFAGFQATGEQLSEVHSCRNGMQLMTHLDPDAPPEVVKSYRSILGQQYKSKGGRPRKKTYSPRYSKLPNKFAHVVRMREQDKSWGEIAKIVGRPRSTIRGWYDKGIAGCANLPKRGE